MNPKKKKKSHSGLLICTIEIPKARWGWAHPSTNRPITIDWTHLLKKFKATQNINASTAHSIVHIQKFITKNNKNKKK